MTTFLLPVPPRGLGTQDVEALDSYTRRLAIGHGVTTHTLLRVLARWWDEVKKPNQPSMGRDLAYAYTSGYGYDIDCLTTVLERSTGYVGLASMTLRAFSKVSGRHVGEILRHVHHWCPACMREWELDSQAPYEKLLWRFKPICRCPIHKLRLENCCPSCGTAQIRSGGRSWFVCSTCAANLCANPDSWRLAPRPSHCEHDLLELLKFCSQHPQCVFFEESPGVFYDQIKGVRGRGRFVDTLGDYFHTKKRPRKSLISSLLRVALQFQVPLVDILIDPTLAAKIKPLPQIDSAQLEDCGARRAVPRNHHIQLHREIQISLNQGLEGRSLDRICAELGVYRTTALYWFPKMAKQLVAHRRKLTWELRERHQNCLQSLSLAELQLSKSSSDGWHNAPRTVAERYGVSIYAARQMLETLR